MHPHIVALALCVPLASATIEIAAGGAGGALILSAAQVIMLTMLAMLTMLTMLNRLTMLFLMVIY